jgi:hypothetical protein
LSRDNADDVAKYRLGIGRIGRIGVSEKKENFVSAEMIDLTVLDTPRYYLWEAGPSGVAISDYTRYSASIPH